MCFHRDGASYAVTTEPMSNHDRSGASGPSGGARRRGRWRGPVLLAIALGAAAMGAAIDPVLPPVEQMEAFTEVEPGRSLRLLLMPLGKGELQLALVAMAGALGLRRRATAALLALVMAGVTVAVLKPAVGTVRPDGGRGSFPSGDVTSATAVAVPLALASPAAWPLAAGVVGGVATFRVLDGVHHAADVGAGVGIGLLVGFAALAAVRGRSRLPGWRFFHVLTALAVVFLAVQLGGEWWRRHVTGLAVYLAPLAVVLAARWGRVLERRWDVPLPRLARHVPAVAAAAVLLLCWLLATGSTLWDRDEPRFARASVEMLESGDWMVPTFNDRLRPDKPAGIYWLMATSAAAFGRSEWAVRLWAGVGLAAATWITGSFVRRRAGPVAGAVAAVLTGLSPLAMAVGTAATTDAVLLGIVTGATVVAAGGLLDGWSAARVAALGLLLGAGQLVKGPVALAVPGLMIGVWAADAALRGDRRWHSHAAALAVAVAIGTGLFLAWALPANAATGGELGRAGLGHHVLERMRRPLESHGGGLLAYLPYYPLVLLLGTMPFSLLLPESIVAAWRRRTGDPAFRRLLAAWIVPPLALFTLVATKLPHYVLPVVPALAALIGLSAGQGALPGTRRARTAGRWLLVASGVSLAAVLASAVWWIPVDEGRRLALGIAATVAVGTWLGVRRHRRGQTLAAVATLAAAVAVGFLQLRALLPVVDALKPAPAVARAVRAAASPSAEIGAVGFQEPSLAFYLGRSFVELDRNAAARWLDGPGERVLIADGGFLQAHSGVATLGEEIARVRGYNFSKGEWVEVVALRSSAGERQDPLDLAEDRACGPVAARDRGRRDGVDVAAHVEAVRCHEIQEALVDRRHSEAVGAAEKEGAVVGAAEVEVDHLDRLVGELVAQLEVGGAQVVREVERVEPPGEAGHPDDVGERELVLAAAQPHEPVEHLLEHRTGLADEEHGAALHEQPFAGAVEAEGEREIARRGEERTQLEGVHVVVPEGLARVGQVEGGEDRAGLVERGQAGGAGPARVADIDRADAQVPVGEVGHEQDVVGPPAELEAVGDLEVELAADRGEVGAVVLHDVHHQVLHRRLLPLVVQWSGGGVSSIGSGGSDRLRTA